MKSLSNILWRLVQGGKFTIPTLSSTIHWLAKPGYIDHLLMFKLLSVNELAPEDARKRRKNPNWWDGSMVLAKDGAIDDLAISDWIDHVAKERVYHWWNESGRLWSKRKKKEKGKKNPPKPKILAVQRRCSRILTVALNLPCWVTDEKCILNKKKKTNLKRMNLFFLLFWKARSEPLKMMKDYIWAVA